MSSNDARSGMNELTIICPNCKTEIKLTEFVWGEIMGSSKVDHVRRKRHDE